ncbi:MAG: hypothetical protein SFX19_02640 [Alphaproteobacteria bacterium]|nr:hypothetical protein [Alphaproteobacteria bacterium]
MADTTRTTVDALRAELRSGKKRAAGLFDNIRHKEIAAGTMLPRETLRTIFARIGFESAATVTLGAVPQSGLPHHLVRHDELTA